MQHTNPNIPTAVNTNVSTVNTNGTGFREKQWGIPMPGTVIRMGCLLDGHPWSLGWLRCKTSPCWEVEAIEDLLSEDLGCSSGLGGRASPSTSEPFGVRGGGNGRGEEGPVIKVQRPR